MIETIAANALMCMALNIYHTGYSLGKHTSP